MTQLRTILLIPFLLVSLVCAAPNITTSGLPLVTDLANVTTVAYDIITRPVVLNLTNEVPPCKADPEFYAWCGGTPDVPYSYCIYTTTWPVPNLVLWLESSYFTDSDAYYKFPLFPSYCTCPTPGRAVFIGAPIVNYPTYTRECPEEIGLLAIHIFLILCFTILSAFLIVDLVVWLLVLLSSKRQFYVWSSFIPKILVLIAALLTIVSICLLLTDRGGSTTPNLYFGQIWTLAFSLVAAVFAYLFWITIFFDMISTVTKMTPTSTKTIGFFRWAVVAGATIGLLGTIVCAVLLYAFGCTLSNASNLVEYTLWDARLDSSVSSMATFAIVAMSICLFWGTGLVVKTMHWILTGQNTGLKSKVEREVFVFKALYTVGATVSFWLVWGSQLAYTIIIGYPNDGPYGASSAYILYGIIPMWILFAQGFCLFFMLVFITLATKTHLEDKTYCQVFSSSVSTLQSGDSSRASSKASQGESRSANTNTNSNLGSA